MIKYALLLKADFRQRHKRPVDIEGNTVDYMLSEHPDEPAAARAFFLAQAGFLTRRPWIKVAPIRMGCVFLLVEQNHRFIKKITKQMKDSKPFTLQMR